MRPSIWIIWLLSLLMAGVAYGASGQRLAPSGNQDRSIWTDKAEGLGRTEEQAANNARRIALEQIEKRLYQEYPHLEWIPSFDYLKERGIVSGQPSVGEKEISGELYKVATLNWKMTLRDREDVLTQNRIRHAESRQTGWGKILMALVIILALSAGYFRLEDATRGYMTHALRVMLAIGITLTLVALWLWL